ncbi:10011_t:CDS:2, partial [Acaulospora colombiana]
MSSLFKPAKQKKTPNSSPSGPSQPSGISEDSSTNSKYQTACDNLIGATKVVKAITEAASFLGPLKSTCEVVILFLEKTKAVNENMEGLKTLANMLRSHIDALERSWLVLQEKQDEPLSTGQQDFIQALNGYIKEKGAKGLFKKKGSSRIEPGVLAAYREEIMQYSKAFDEATVVCQMNIQAEALKAARLGPEKPRPMGTQHEPCLKGTREPILQEIREWRDAKTIDTRIFWLCDIGGSGKSTVAYTMSQEWHKSADILVGRFFFSKNARDTADTDIFCSTLSRDIASKHLEIGSTITDILKIDSLLTERDFNEQFCKLIVEPLRSTLQDIVFVIDAVDECKLESRKKMLRVLLQALGSLPTLKVLLTSRPESDIMNLLRDKSIIRGMHFEMQGSSNQSNIADITSYVDHHLSDLLPLKYRQQLVAQSNGLFIWVSTARFELELAADNPTDFNLTFTSLLTRGTGGDVDTLYLGILNRVLRGQSKDLISCVLATLAILYEPVSINSLGHLINASDEELELVRDLKQDICDIDVPGDPFPDNKAVIDLDDRLSALWQSSPSLFYGSQYWVLHVCQAIQNATVVRDVELLLETKDLLGLQRNLEEYWPHNKAIEARNFHNNIRIIEYLYLICNTRLSRIYRKSFEADLPDIPCGLEAHWPQNRTLAGHSSYVRFISLSVNGTRVISGSDDGTVLMWDTATGARLGALSNIQGRIIHLAYSLDDSHVIIGTKSGYVTRWDGSTSEMASIELQCNTGIIGEIKCLFFSPNEAR